MNKKLGLAVAGALLALSSTANAGITIPAGDWTVDISGNVNAFTNFTKADRAKGTALTGGIAVGRDANGEDRANGINTGLLPAWIGISGKTRQNDLDVAFTISFQPNVSENSAAGDAIGNGSVGQLNRQAFLSFGDASWGTVKLGKDIGIYADEAILHDMTLLGVGAVAAANSGASTTWGGIGTGYQYAAWKGQVAYTTPNWNGFQATIGVTNPNQGVGADAIYQDRLGVEGKASYTFTGDVSGKVWTSFASYDVSLAKSAYTVDETIKVTAWDIGGNVNYGQFGLTGYYYDGNNNGTTTLMGNAFKNVGGSVKGRDGDGGYVQATYLLPTNTKLGLAYGISNLSKASGQTNAQEAAIVEENRRWTIGAYHALTKSLNLVAEYSDIKSEGQVSSNKQESKNVSLGAILFF